MTHIHSQEDLQRFRQETMEKRKAMAESGLTQIYVSLGTCGIAAGAADTFKAIQAYTEEYPEAGISVEPTGCIGQCEREPIIQVILGEHGKVTYGKVTPEIAVRILKEHVQGGAVIKEFII